MRQVADQVISGVPRHDVVSMVYALPALVSEGIGKNVGNFGRVGGTERRDVCYTATLAGKPEHIKNTDHLVSDYWPIMGWRRGSVTP